MSSDPSAAALDAGNEVFHEAYGGARDGVRTEVPVLVVLPTELALHRQNRRQGVPYPRPSFAQAKSAAHIAVALFTLDCAESNPENSRAAVAKLCQYIAAALDAQRAERAPVEDEIEALLQRCLDYARAAREQAPSERARAEFASDAGPRVLRITELATCEQIAGLHEAVEATLSTLSASDQALLQVVVIGDHQARARSLGMQYFKRRFREDPEVDRRVTYGENIESEEEAISLVATRRLDERIAQAFFGDEHRLQRDVLGDAAKRCLDQMCFPGP
ncbi:MAG: hypothetical protein WDO74_08690 [Pseudomonadota bacterium]